MSAPEIAARVFIGWPVATLMVGFVEMIVGSLGLAVVDTAFDLSEEAKDAAVKDIVTAMFWTSPVIGGVLAATVKRPGA